MANFYRTLETVIKKDKRFFSKDTETLLRNKVYELAVNMDSALIKLLLSNNETKSRFFTDIDGVLVFDKIAFGWAVNNHQFLPDSYTRFKNRIGLADSNGNLISASNDVVLSFPYKDCILEGGQTREDQKRDEVFYNSILAPDDVDRLLYPKVLVGAKRYTVNGVEEGITFKDDDNLIIKGNNLLAISSLLKRFEGKIKCIYIDPPYNTGTDSFRYNDSFTHSAWLTFMKNRLVIAKRLLHEKGSLFVQIGAEEQAYLKVLLDEIFGRDNFRTQIVWQRSSSGKTISRDLPSDVDYIIWFSKTDLYTFNPVYKPLSEATKAMYNKDDGNDRGKYRLYPLQKTSSPGPETTYDYIDNTGRVWPCPKKGWRMKQSKIKALEENGRLYFDGKTISEKAYWDERETTGKLANNFWDDIFNLQGANAEKYDFTGQKPEKLIKRIFEMSTDIGDTVLDFHLGTGTSVAVAHKMKRHYLGIEQMDYIDEYTVQRLVDVIKGDDNGISDELNWKGGGSFVYCELAKCNQNFIDKATAAKTDKELIALLDEIIATGFISHKVFPSDISEAVDEFVALSLADKKRFILELLDKNMLYVNLCDMNDKDYAISKEDKAFTTSFYKKEGK